MNGGPGLIAYKLSFEISPIILTGGVASFLGGVLPIVVLTQSLSFLGGVLGGGTDLDLNNFFANFQPLPNSNLIEQQIAKVPFANQSVAANAVIQQPLNLSMLMTCPARGPGGYALKLATMTALKAVLDAHNAAGGTYTVATPSFIYTNGILENLVDVSSGDTIQRQSKYQWNFEFPLLTLQQAQQAQNSLMSQLSAQTPIDGSPSWSGLPTITGAGGIGTPLNIAPVLPAGISAGGAGVTGSLSAIPQVT